MGYIRKNIEFIALISILVMTLFFISCSNAEPETIGQKEVQTGEPEETEEMMIQEEPASVAEVQSITPEEVYEDMQSGDPQYYVIDVRTQEEYDEAHIEGVAHIPVDTIEERLEEIPRDKPIVLYCRSGGRSGRAAEILVENGFNQVYNMGGLPDWIEKGYPVATE